MVGTALVRTALAKMALVRAALLLVMLLWGGRCTVRGRAVGVDPLVGGALVA